MSWREPIKLIGDEPPEFLRASHLAICAVCLKTYQQHQIYEWGCVPLYLFRTCDGAYWKL
jgi:hypothetical protein